VLTSPNPLPVPPQLVWCLRMYSYFGDTTLVDRKQAPIGTSDTFTAS